MNYIEAKVSDIKSVENLSIVSFEAEDTKLKMMSLSLNTKISLGSKVRLGVKASSIALAKNLSGMISMSNQLPCIVESINKGELLCSIKLRFNDALLESITTLQSVIDMDINEGDEILCLIKASELSILEVLS